MNVPPKPGLYQVLYSDGTSDEVPFVQIDGVPGWLNGRDKDIVGFEVTVSGEKEISHQFS